MGNRAVITFKKENVSVYLHYNGGRASVEAMLDACKELMGDVGDYGPARFCQVVGNFFGGSMSLGVGPAGSFYEAAEDHGVYYVEGWDIVGRNGEWTEEIDPKKTARLKAELLRINRPFFEKSIEKIVVYRRKT